MQQPELSIGHKYAVKMVPTHDTTHHQRKLWKGSNFHHLPSLL